MVKVKFPPKIIPDKWQKRAIEKEGDILIEGGPGGGKTTTMGLRARHMIAGGISPHSIRGVNFSVAADLELKKVLLEVPARNISTLHALGYKVLCKVLDMKRLPVKSTAVVLHMRWPLMSQQEVQEAAAAIDANRVLDPNNPKFDEGYESYKKGCHYLDFIDLLLQLQDLLRRGVAQEIIGQQHLLVDEFQDIDRLMFDCLQLMEPITISAIGDSFQSMYGFRGAYPAIFNDFKRVFNIPASSVCPLKGIHRHGQGIIDAYEKLFPRGMVSLEGSGGEVKVLRGRGPLGELDLLEQLVKPGDTILARTHNQLMSMLETASFSCSYHTPSNSLDGGFSTKVRGSSPYVHLRTLHDAKGRTFNNAFIIGVDEGLLPHIRAEDFEEEKRLLYVGMSRPKGNLYLMYNEEPSRFLEPLKDYEVDDMAIRRL